MFNGYAYGSTSPPLNNNPFIDHSASTAQRYPDISQTSDPSAWAATQQPQYQQQPQSQQPWQANGYYTPQIHQPQQTAFQPQSSFGQGLVSGTSYGYLNGAQQQQQQPSYNPVQQQLQQNPNYIAQFDPYSAISHGWGDSSQPTSTNNFGATATTGITSSGTGGGQYPSSHINTPLPPSAASTSVSGTGEPHPRVYIRTHKALIESWDATTWKGFLDLFEKLKAAWEGRKRELEARVGVLNNQMSTLQMQSQAGGTLGYAGYLQVQQYQQEVARVQGLVKEADTNFGSVAASTFQMQEVFHGYRLSGDAASKRLVREATNAALQSLPDWPQQFI